MIMNNNRQFRGINFCGQRSSHSDSLHYLSNRSINLFDRDWRRQRKGRKVNRVILQIVGKKIIHFLRGNLHGQTLLLPVSSDLIDNMMEFFVVRNARSELELQRILPLNLANFLLK